MTKKFPEQHHDTVKKNLSRNAEISYAIRAISDVLKADTNGCYPDVEVVRPGLHYALSILSADLQKLADSDMGLEDFGREGEL